MKLWGGRFTKETDQLVNQFNSSISFDQRFYKEDIQGSIAHATMLGKMQIISEKESITIVDGLKSILSDLENQALIIDESFEDIHSFIESTLISRIGEVGKKLHTGRSRNDQVALDMKMYVKKEIIEIKTLLKNLQKSLLFIIKDNIYTIMPGYTHLQKAQPITLAHHLMSYFEMLKRDSSRLDDCYTRMNVLPLGSGALAATTFQLDREYVAELLDFDRVTLNSIDGVSDRDYLIELLSALSTLMMHLSRFSEEIILWASNEWQFVTLDDGYSTGSSIMPQKKNPDIAELVRGKVGRVYGSLLSILTVMKGIPLAYNKDMQEDKELTFDSIDTVKGCLSLFNGMLSTITFNKETMYQSAKKGFTNATDAADYLVMKGVPFRDAHEIVGKLVLHCETKGITLDKMTIEEYQEISPVFGNDIFTAVQLETCVERRNVIGGPSPTAMLRVIAINEQYLGLDK